MILNAVWITAMAAAGQAPLTFPKGFKWCVATAAHQIEGNNSNSDWWDWEQLPGKIKRGDRSGQACDHWNKLEQDVDLIASLNVGEYRFSVEWAKIEPQPGVWDAEVTAHYRHEIALLRARGIEPMITIHHFTLPRWFREKGGWEWDQAAKFFARYAEYVVTEIAPDVKDWITINEPMIHLVQGYMNGVAPPGEKRKMQDLAPPMVAMIKAHAAAYSVMKKATKASGMRIGIAHHLRVFDPPSWYNFIDSYLAGKFDYAFNWAFAEALETGRLKFSIPQAASIDVSIPEAKGTQDYIGVNYYSRDIVRVDSKSPAGFTLSVPKNAPTNDMGWEIYPKGFYRILKETAKRFPGKAIFVTENGIADSNDSKRPAFLRAHLAAMHKAIREGAKVEGYCHWSLYDNFEWTDGFGPRFGLVEIDYRNLSRIPRQSASDFARIAKTNQVTP